MPRNVYLHVIITKGGGPITSNFVLVTAEEAIEPRAANTIGWIASTSAQNLISTLYTAFPSVWEATACSLLQIRDQDLLPAEDLLPCSSGIVFRWSSQNTSFECGNGDAMLLCNEFSWWGALVASLPELSNTVILDSSSCRTICRCKADDLISTIVECGPERDQVYAPIKRFLLNTMLIVKLYDIFK